MPSMQVLCAWVTKVHRTIMFLLYYTKKCFLVILRFTELKQQRDFLAA